MTSDPLSFLKTIPLSCKTTALWQSLTKRSKATTCSLLMALSATLIVSNTPAHAQNVWNAEVQTIDTERPKFHVRNMSGPAGTQLKIRIRLPRQQISANSSLTFYGLPDKILLSAGVRKSKVWIVPVSKAKNLTLIAPRNFRGVFESAAILRKKNGQVIEGQRFVVNILKHSAKKPKPVPEPKPQVMAKKPKPVKKAAPEKRVVKLEQKKEKTLSKSQKAFRALSLSTTNKPAPLKKVEKNISDDLEQTLLAKGKQLLKDGNIEAARETLKFLADQGNAESAYLVAQSYDPEEFKNFNAIGVEPDLEEAKRWYTKAAELGSPSARSRLKEYADAGL